MKIYPELQCSTCGYIPDDEDIEKTDYELKTCETCGQENVCCLCLHYHPVIKDDDWDFGKSMCPKCNPSYNLDGSLHLLGKDRKFWLEDEYEEENS
ncbi:MAG: hypothetical protein WDA59_04270 [Methanofastidiosum sp.]